MSTTRLLRSSNKPSGRVFASSSPCPSSISVKTSVKCTSKGGGLNGEKKICGNSERKPAVAVKATSTTTTTTLEATETSVDWGRELASLLTNAIGTMHETLIRPMLKPRPWTLHVQMLIQNGILNCRFLTIFAVAGTLVGSILCFMEGSFLIAESYLQYFKSLLSQKIDQEHIIHILIEAIGIKLGT